LSTKRRKISKTGHGWVVGNDTADHDDFDDAEDGGEDGDNDVETKERTRGGDHVPSANIDNQPMAAMDTPSWPSLAWVSIDNFPFRV
jgi:hypothetical protein